MQVKVEQQVCFWAVLGPFITILALGVISLRMLSSGEVYLALAAIIGLPVCWKWKRVGLALAFCLLVALLLFGIAATPVDQRFWLIGMAMAIAISFIVTSLSLEEVSAIIHGVQQESEYRKEHLWNLDERLQTIQNQLEKERKSWEAQSEKSQQFWELLTNEQKAQNEQLLNKNRALELANQAAQQQLELLHVKQASLDFELKKQIEACAVLDASLKYKQNELEQKEALFKQHDSQKAQLQQQLQQEKAKEQDYLSSLQQVKAELAAVAIAKAETEAKMTELEQKLQAVKPEFSHYLYEQLKRQFAEKQAMLDSTRQELFKTKEALMVVLQKVKERRSECSQMELSDIERQYQTEIEALEEIIRQDRQEIDELYQLIACTIKCESGA